MFRTFDISLYAPKTKLSFELQKVFPKYVPQMNSM